MSLKNTENSIESLMNLTDLGYVRKNYRKYQRKNFHLFMF